MNKGRKAFRAGFKGRKFAVRNYILCESFFSKARGLMFRRKNFRTPLYLSFRKPGRYPIHSFFCRKFLAVWTLKGRIIDVKLVKPWGFAVTPKEKFDGIIEIPAQSSEKRNI